MIALGLGVLWLAERAYTATWLAGIAALARAVGQPVDELSYGTGPAAATLGRLRVGVIPAGGWGRRADDAPYPALLLAGPHLVLALPAAALAASAYRAAMFGWLLGLVGFGPGTGVVHGLVGAAAAAAADPLGVGIAVWSWLGLVNVAVGLVQAATRRALPVFAAFQLALFVLLLRALWLDLRACL